MCWLRIYKALTKMSAYGVLLWQQGRGVAFTFCAASACWKRLLRRPIYYLVCGHSDSTLQGSIICVWAPFCDCAKAARHPLAAVRAGSASLFSTIEGWFVFTWGPIHRHAATQALSLCASPSSDKLFNNTRISLALLLYSSSRKHSDCEGLK